MSVKQRGRKGGRKSALPTPQQVTAEELLALVGMEFGKKITLPNDWRLTAGKAAISLRSFDDDYRGVRQRGLIWPRGGPGKRFGGLTTLENRQATRALAIALVCEVNPGWANRNACG